MKRSVAVLVAVLLTATLATPALAGPKPQPGPAVRVMTQNLYVGADLFRLLTPPADTECGPFLGGPLEVPCLAAETLAVVQQTNFPERARAIAAQIEREKPDLIGLQEVSLIRVQVPGDFVFGNPVPAEDVLYDYLDILMAALAERGLDYSVAATITEADVELPYLAGFDPGTGQPILNDVRLTDRDVILARSGVATADAAAATFATQLTLTIGGVPVEFTRGWVAVDATVKGKEYRFVNTHLEVGSAAPIRNLQAIELATVLAAETLPVVLVGDFNVRPDEGPVEFPPGNFIPSAYTTLTDAGYVDVWTVRKGKADPGFTCCQDEKLDNAASAHDERIDMIFVRNADGLGPVQASVLGEEPGDKTPGGLWPSDHAGVAAKLKVLTPKH